jgi:hypothetical protein
LSEEFEPLDTAIYVEARRQGLQDARPREDTATCCLDGVKFFGWTNVPGVWDIQPDRPVTLTMMMTQGWRAAMLALRALAEASIPPANKPSDEPTQQLPTIWYHGERSYSQGRQRPIKVSNEMHNILQAFLGRDVALDTKKLSDIVANVTTVVKKLVEKFGENAISRPKGKGDGYFIRVRSLKPQETTN